MFEHRAKLYCVQYSEVKDMTKARAVLIGINYRGTANELRGCYNDALNIRDYLIETKYTTEDRITMLAEATRKQIIDALEELGRASHDEKLDKVCFSISSHGSYVPCRRSSEEPDGNSECICPFDFDESGMILDTELHEIFSRYNKSTKITVLVDACHSGSAMNLEHCFDPYLCAREIQQRAPMQQKVVSISGCMDAQTSADSLDPMTQRFAGAMTTALLYSIKTVPGTAASAEELVCQMRKKLKQDGFPQLPQLTSSVESAFNEPFF